MKKRTLFLAMTALMITMTSGGSLTAVYADEIPTEAAETSESTELPIKPLTAKIVDENPYMAKSDLYKISGHWDHYKEGMFVLGDEEKDDEVMALRPMTLQMRCFLLISIQKSMFLMRRQIQMLLLQSFLTLTDMP
mgnify:CR=1 FL=1